MTHKFRLYKSSSINVVITSVYVVCDANRMNESEIRAQLILLTPGIYVSS